ncbi:3'(2'),5'-bisphosphate nucleotidase CysQ [Robiginitalea sp. M366]|uniref:3'(2'),5'-bisphosphate nucleotidase CysQ n=1 Tax=Robiginitalea aestuariiviva TaxID=3036903 RepID=UPI00240CEB27|nr:3'(2'),5'-bisphosphate nucleotidase CysQ [Robiginitalea aestuariiviva]MDG1572710.1 3'(2'),5'-bisphosphate nucleotidase CysQ [Robiginitalea aestuariiviva]
MPKTTQIALEAAIEAGRAILEVYRAERPVQVTEKADQSPVTEADLAANRILNERLATTGYPILSEENTAIPFAQRESWGRCWVVDPLDGTREFLKRNGEFTVNVALCEGGQAVFGVIYAPVAGVLYYGDAREASAYRTLVPAGGALPDFWETQDRLATPDQVAGKVRILVSRSHRSPETLDYLETLAGPEQEVEWVEKGSALKFGLLAEGKADLYPRLGPTMEWDTAAGSALVGALGFEVLALGSGAPLHYNREDLVNPDFIVKRRDR